MASDVVLVLTAVWKQAELGERREHLRSEVAVVGDDVAPLSVAAETRDQLLLLEHHHTDRCVHNTGPDYPLCRLYHERGPPSQGGSRRSAAKFLPRCFDSNV